MRAQREAALEEADRQRKIAAQAKLVELEERIARRQVSCTLFNYISPTATA